MNVIVNLQDYPYKGMTRCTVRIRNQTPYEFWLDSGTPRFRNIVIAAAIQHVGYSIQHYGLDPVDVLPLNILTDYVEEPHPGRVPGDQS